MRIPENSLLSAGLFSPNLVRIPSKKAAVCGLAEKVGVIGSMLLAVLGLGHGAGAYHGQDTVPAPAAYAPPTGSL